MASNLEVASKATSSAPIADVASLATEGEGPTHISRSGRSTVVVTEIERRG